MAEATTLYICPTCGCPDLMIAKSSLLVAAKERRTECPNCKWAGTLAEASGIATTEKIYDTQTILNLLLYTVTKHAAGPIAQAFQFFGLLEKDDKEGLDHIMREATAGLIEKAFMAAAENAAKRGQIGTSEETKQTCPWCGGRHIIGEEHNFETGQPDHCPKCGGKGVLTPDEISKFEEEDWPRKRDKEETLVGRIKLPPGVRAEDVEIKHGGSMSVVNSAAVEKLTIDGEER